MCIHGGTTVASLKRVIRASRRSLDRACRRRYPVASLKVEGRILACLCFARCVRGVIAATSLNDAQLDPGFCGSGFHSATKAALLKYVTHGRLDVRVAGAHRRDRRGFVEARTAAGRCHRHPEVTAATALLSR